MLFKVKSTVFGWKPNWKPQFLAVLDLGYSHNWKPHWKLQVFGQKPQFLAVLDLGSSHNWKPHWKLQFSAKNCGFWLGSSHNWKPHWKPWFSAKNHGFWLGSSHFWKPCSFWCWKPVFGWKPWFLTRLLPQLKTTLKTAVSGWKLQFLALAPPTFENRTENCGFQPKTASKIRKKGSWAFGPI